MNKIILVIVFWLVILIQLSAQVKTNFNNTATLNERGYFNKTYLTSIYEIAPPDLRNAFRRDKTEDSLSSKVYYIAEPVSVNINIVTLAKWVSDGINSYAKFTLKARGAKTLSINFSNFFLPKGTEMFIYNKGAEMITGVITEMENNDNKIWGSSIYRGDELNVEIKIPSSEKENWSLVVTNIAYGYKDIFINKTGGFGKSGPCNVNVLCPAGNNWVAERNTVVYIATSDGKALCSGAMVMNTCAMNIPYVLTADHCFQGNGNVAGWRVHFQAWSSTCSPSQNSDGILFNGSTLRANWAPSDFCLVQLNQTPAANSGIHYAGWTRQTNAAASGVGIHHPSGDVMKISTYTTPLVREDDPVRCSINAVGTLHWVVQWNQGVTEGGSSGSPLFDQNHRIVGQLSGGPSSCPQPANCRMDMYGRFDNSWTGGGTNATRLSNWLDPGNIGSITTNTTNISNLNVTPVGGTNLTITGSNVVCGNSATYTVNSLPNATVTWQLFAPVVGGFSCALPLQNVCTMSPSGNQVTLTKVNNGNIRLRATVTNCNGVIQYSYPKDITFGTPDATYDGGYSAYSGPCKPIVGTVNMTNGSQTWVSMAFPNNNQYTITKTSGSPNATWSNTGSGSFNFTFTNPNSSSNIGFNITTTNSCGTRSDPVVFYYNGPSMFSAVPNPASNTVTITAMQMFTDKKVMIRQLKILDNTGRIKLFKNYEEGSKSVQINVNNLSSNIYYLHIYDGEQWSVQKLTILH